MGDYSRLAFKNEHSIATCLSHGFQRPLWVVLCQSWLRRVLVKSDANGWLGRMQMGGQVSAITQEGELQTRSLIDGMCIGGEVVAVGGVVFGEKTGAITGTTSNCEIKRNARNAKPQQGRGLWGVARGAF